MTDTSPPAPSRAFAFVALLALLCTPAAASEPPERMAAYRDWRVSFDAGRCTLHTGGDGSGSIEVRFEMGGFNASASYLPIVYSNYPIPLRADDSFEVFVDGQASDFGPEMGFFDGQDMYGRYFVGAALTGGFVPDLVAAFRAGDTTAIEVAHAGEAPFVMDRFSLSGFTASYLKASEWCHFDPNGLFRS